MTSAHTIRLERHIAAPPAKVWRCWTDPQLLPQWFGPAGHSCKTISIDLRQGGHWQFDMIGPDGTVYPNLHRYTLFDAPHRIEFTMYGAEGDPPHSWVVVTFSPDGTGTRLVQNMTLPTREIYETVIGFGAVELGNTTLAKLAAMAEGL